MKSRHDKQEVQRVEITFVDDSDFCTKGDESQIKMQEIVDYHARMCEDTGGKIQQEKVMKFDWKWKKDKIVELKINVNINGVNVKCINIFNSGKTLGVYKIPSLNWNDEFEHVKLKLKKYVKS